MSVKESKISYDAIVIGAGLSGLATAAHLSLSKKVLLLEATDRYGGSHHPIQATWGVRTNGFRFLPGTDDTKRALHFLSTALKLPEVGIVESENPPMTEVGGALTPFIGFGDATPAHYDALSYFLSPTRIEASVPPQSWPTLLMEAFTGDFQPMSQVSKIEIEDGHAVGVWVNGQKLYRAKHIVFAASLPLFPHLVMGTPMHPKFKSEFARTKFATAVQLDLLHTTALCDSKAVLCLGYESGSEPLPTIGSFYDVTTEAPGIAQYSQWVSYVNDEESEDPDIIGEALRKMRRVIKKAFPAALEGPLRERIGVVPHAHFEATIKSKDGLQSNHLKNVYFAHGEMSKPQNLVGCLLQAEKISHALQETTTSAEPRTPDLSASEDQSAHPHTEMGESPSSFDNRV